MAKDGSSGTHPSRRFDPSHRHHLSDVGRRGDPESVLDLLPIRPADSIADIGAGTGFFALPLARRLTQGRVYALDVSEEMLQTLRERLAGAAVANVDALLCGETSFPLPPSSQDGVLLFFVLHEIEDHPALLRAAASLLKAGGWMALLEWRPRTEAGEAEGPPAGIRIAPEEARRLLAEAGLDVVQESRIGTSYYFALARSPAGT